MLHFSKRGLLATTFFVTTLAVLGLTIFSVNRDANFETRSAAQAIASNLTPSLVNGERMYFKIVSTSVTKNSYYVKLFNRRGGTVEEGPIRWNNGIYEFLSTNLQPGNTYFAWVYACEDENCDIVSVSPAFETSDLSINEPEGHLEVIDSYCQTGTVQISEFNTNREKLRYQITSSDGENTVTLTPQSALKTITLEPRESVDYTITFSCCVDFTLKDMGGIYTSCTNPSQFIGGSRTYKASSCETPKVDVEVTEVAVPSPVLNTNEIKGSTTIKDSATATESADVMLKVELLNSQSSVVSSQSFDIPAEMLIENDSYKQAFTFAKQSAGNYSVKVTAVALNDVDTANNTKIVAVVVYSPEPTGCPNQCSTGLYQKEDCSCVECLGDTNCASGEYCNAQNTCACDTSVCSDNKVMNSECTACVCTNICGANQWQDDSCGCHDQTCTLTCSDKQVLTPECTCRDVDCTNDDHCSGLQTCTSSNTCSCDITCSAGKVINSTCTACVCASTCAAGESQRADCSCVVGEVLMATTEEVVLEIETSRNTTSVLVGDKELFSVKIVGDYDINPELISWQIDGEEVGTGVELIYTYKEVGDVTIDLYYDGEKKNSVERLVIEKKVEPKAEEEPVVVTEEPTKDNTILYFALVVLAFAIAGTGFILFWKRKKKDEEKKEKIDSSFTIDK